MDLGDNITFDNQDDEIKFWKEKAHSLNQE